MESLANAQGSQRRAFAIRRNAGEALTRVDIQHDLLHHIFADTHRAFTNPTRTLHGAPPGTKVTFRDLYVNYLCNVPRISKTLRLKMLQMPEYATDYAKVALLCNVGRINTTMAFFPEMRTQLRTYHPIPSLQHTEESLQDAPRIKNLLKSALLDEEVGAPPMTPGDVLLLARHGRVPSTSAPNLLFIFGNHALSISDTHFADAGTQDFRDFFLPIPFSSASRARAFLWLCYHYLEPPESQNPFASHLQDPDKIPWLHRLTLAEMEAENVDTDAERMCIERMAQQRRTFRAQGMNREAGGNLDPSGRVKRKRKPKIETTTERAHADDDGGIVMVNTAAEAFHTSFPRLRRSWSQPQTQEYEQLQASGYTYPYPHEYDASDYEYHQTSTHVRPASSRHERAVPPGGQLARPRSMIDYAWNVALNSDPLASSDEDVDGDDMREDCMNRLRVIRRLQGRPQLPLNHDIRT